MTLLERFQAYCQAERDERKASACLVSWLRKESRELHDRIIALVEAATFNTRSYGRGQFYTWAEVPGLPFADPWPASQFPRKVLAAQIALAIEDGTFSG